MSKCCVFSLNHERASLPNTYTQVGRSTVYTQDYFVFLHELINYMINLRLHIGGSAYSGDIYVFSVATFLTSAGKGLPKCCMMWIREDRSQMSRPVTGKETEKTTAEGENNVQKNVCGRTSM